MHYSPAIISSDDSTLYNCSIIASSFGIPQASTLVPSTRGAKKFCISVITLLLEVKAITSKIWLLLNQISFYLPDWGQLWWARRCAMSSHSSSCSPVFYCLPFCICVSRTRIIISRNLAALYIKYHSNDSLVLNLRKPIIIPVWCIIEHSFDKDFSLWFHWMLLSSFMSVTQNIFELPSW